MGDPSRTAQRNLNSDCMKQLRRWRRRVALAYHLRCAREDARARNIMTPIGVWVCEHCPQVSLTLGAHLTHAHA
jgi:hypothetical protein